MVLNPFWNFLTDSFHVLRLLRPLFETISRINGTAELGRRQMEGKKNSAEQMQVYSDGGCYDLIQHRWKILH